MERRKRDYIFILLKGVAMGAADVVPGVSGGTIAFVSGIYEELIASISKINIRAVKILKNNGIRSFWEYINGNFFVALFVGIGISILSLAKGIKWLLENEPIGVWSFFFGLMVASILFLAKDIKKWNFAVVLSMLISCFIAYYITTIPPMGSSDKPLFLFFAGALAICAMILPGVSGAFILVLLGGYHVVLQAIDDKNLKIIGIVALGAIFGILTFSRFLKWLFAKYRNLTIAGLTGFVIGALNKIWPWKQILDFEIDAHGKKIILLEKSILPTSYQSDPQLILAILMSLIGFLLLYGIEKWAFYLKER